MRIILLIAGLAVLEIASPTRTPASDPKQGETVLGAVLGDASHDTKEMLRPSRGMAMAGK